MSAILIIDDEPQNRHRLRVVLEAQDHRIFEAPSGRDGLIEAATHLPDAIILDLGLPDLSGLDVLRQLRQWSQAPVLILSVPDAEEDRILALNEGAADYVTKPFNSQELLARLRALLRQGQPADDPVLEVGALKMDFAARVAWVNGRELELTATEYSLLCALMQHAGQIVTDRQLLATVWGLNAAEHSQYLEVHLSHIRKKLTDLGLPADTIRTEADVGYRLLAP